MGAYSIYLDHRKELIATKAASETGLTVKQYIEKIVDNHLDKLESETAMDKVVGK